jgi:membrane-associated phospholipid phosphatase
MRDPASLSLPAERSFPMDDVADARCAADACLRTGWAWMPPLAGLLALAAVLATGTNRALFLWLNRAGHPLGEGVWLDLTLLGDGAVALALLLPMIRRAPQRFWAGVVAALVAVAWTQGLKHAVDLPRPAVVFGPGMFFHAGPPLRHGSFPSGHAAAAFALAGIWIMSLRGRLLRLGLLALATLVALSRVMVGVHWPVDILGGMLGGWCAAWIGLAVAGRRGWDARGWPALAIGILLLALCAALLVSGHAGAPGVPPLQRLVAAICLACGIGDIAVLLAWRRAAGSVDG